MCNPFCKNYFDRKFTISPPPGRRLRDPGNSRRCRKLLQLVEAFRSLRSFPVIQAQLQGLLRAASAVSQREGLRVAGTAIAVWVSGLSDRPTPLSLRLPHRRGVLPTPHLSLSAQRACPVALRSLAMKSVISNPMAQTSLLPPAPVRSCHLDLLDDQGVVLQMALRTPLSNALPSLRFASWWVIPLVTAARSQRVLLLLLLPRRIGPHVFLTQPRTRPLDLAPYSSAPFSLAQSPLFLAGTTGSLSCVFLTFTRLVLPITARGPFSGINQSS